VLLYLIWIVVLTAPLIALALTARGVPLRRATSGTGCAAAANDATAATVPPEVAAGAFRRREHSREFRWGRSIHPAMSNLCSAPTRPVHPERSADDGSPKTNISTLIAILRKESSCPLRSPAVD
jgi:hypothetical protein